LTTIYLDDTQARMLFYGITELKKDKNFSDEIADKYYYMFVRNLALSATLSDRVQNLFPNAFKIEVSERLLNYLIRLTGINPFNKIQREEYIGKMEQLNEKLKGR
jgi:hypothetical protein